MANKKDESVAGTLATLRATHNNNVEIVHVYSGARRSIDRDTFDDEDRFEAAGFCVEDWVEASEFTGVKPHPREATTEKAAAQKK